MSVSETTTRPPRANPVTPSGRIPSLDGLRAVSILLVLGGHLWLTFPLCGRWVVLIRPIVINDHLGVMIFFVLSGYLITHLLLRELRTTGTIQLKRFYIRRAFRIVPAFSVFIAAIVLLVMAGVVRLYWSGVVLAASFLWNYQHLFVAEVGPDHGDCGHLWTLSIEEQFYLLWPVLLLRLGPKRAAYFAATLIVLSPLVRVGSYFLLPHSRDHIPTMLHTQADCLMFGCLTALLSHSSRGAPVLQRRVTGRLAAMAAILIFLIDPFLSQRWRGIYLLPVGTTLEGVCIALLLLWAVRAEGVAGRILNAKPLVHLGVISYSLYLWQQLFANAEASPLGQFPINLIGCFLAAEVSYRLIERPFLRLRQRVFPSPASSLPPLRLGEGRGNLD